MEKISVSEKLQAALLKVNELVEISDKLVKKTKNLSSSDKESLPEFTGLWDKDIVEQYLRRLEESIDEPLISNARSLLEKEDIPSEKIAKNILKEIDTIKEVVELLKDLTVIPDFVNKLKSNEGILIRQWLINETAIDNLGLFVKSKNDVQKIFQNLNFPSEVKNNIAEKILKNPNEISETITKSENLSLFVEKIIKRFELHLESTDIEDILSKSYDMFVIIEKIYGHGFSDDNIKLWIAKKNIDDAYDILEKKNKEIEQEHRSLVDDFNSIASILQSMRYEKIDEPPKRISDLKEKVDNLRQALVKRLGEKGSKLLDFLLGKVDEFPRQLSFNYVKKILQGLRPIFSQVITKIKRGDE